MLSSRQLRNPALFDKVVDANTAASLIQDGMTVGISGFTPAGYPKAVPLALAEQVRNGRRCRITLTSGASVGSEVEEVLSAVGAIARRYPYFAASHKSMRDGINCGTISYFDMHLGTTAQHLSYGFLGKIDVAIVEAVAITEEGNLILTTGVGNTPTIVKLADKVIIELNTKQSPELEGIHDIYMMDDPPNRKPVPLCHVSDRIGTPYVVCGIDRIDCIVETEYPDKEIPLPPPDEKSRMIADNLIWLLKREIREQRMPRSLLPIQSGIGSIANAVLSCMIDCEFDHLNMFSEILQNSVFDLIDAGKIDMASGCAFTPSQSILNRFNADPEKYKKHLILRPLEISNCPEVIRRLGCISVNAAMEIDVYGHENSTHVLGTHIMSGIGGSGDFARNAYLAIFATKSTAKDDKISRIVPMCSHVDSTEHDAQIYITEWGVADMRGLSPTERSRVIINNCAHPKYRDKLLDYCERAEREVGGHEPHILEEALSWHVNYKKKGSMLD